jgi:prevent-host-death family protein
MDASIRQLKANLSGLIRRVEAGETVTVRVRSRRVARIVPIAERQGLKELARLPGVSWRGGKPKGIARGERLPRGRTVAALVIEDRR